MYSDDLGKTWSTPRQLITTPFLNISTLVRNAPVFHQDGTIGLPVYHEFLGKFAEYLYISPNGEVTRSEEHTSELQSLMRISYAVFCLKQKKPNITITNT